ncbi:MAG: hypothetical protein ABI551_24835, partial [Polyangiaceae bacterium]
MRHLIIVSALAAGAVFGTMAACGSSDDGSTFGDDSGAGSDAFGEAGDPFLDGLTSVDVTPTNAVVEATPTKAGTQAFTVTGHFAGAPDKDVTSHARFGLSDAGLGAVAGGAFTSTTTRGGKSALNVSVGSATTSTSLTVHFTATTKGPDNGSPLPSDPSKSFVGSADPARAPKLAYPNDKTMLPPNVALLDVHWEPGPASNTLYEISFESASIDLKTFLRCTKPPAGQPQPIANGCIFALDPTTYTYLAKSNAGGDPVTVRVRGGDDAGSGFGESSTVAIQFAETDVQGGLYYWTTTAQAIMRFDFGNPTKAPEVFLNAANVTDPNPKNGGSCVGCHAISRDGTKIVASLDGEGAGWAIFDNDLSKTISGKITGDTTNNLQFSSFNPDGSRFVSVADGDDAAQKTLFVNDGTTGARLPSESIVEGYIVDHPDWSPDGNKIAFDHPTSLSNNVKQLPLQSGIDVITKSGSTWSASAPLVTSIAGKNRFNPNFAPDSTFLVFTESTCKNGSNDDTCDGDSDPSARTWAVAAGGGTPIELAN